MYIKCIMSRFFVLLKMLYSPWRKPWMEKKKNKGKDEKSSFRSFFFFFLLKRWTHCVATSSLWYLSTQNPNTLQGSAAIIMKQRSKGKHFCLMFSTHIYIFIASCTTEFSIYTHAVFSNSKYLLLYCYFAHISNSTF